jgi:hypothetical protein
MAVEIRHKKGKLTGVSLVKKIAIVFLVALLLSSCTASTKEDEKYVGLLKLYLAEFGQQMNDLNGYIAKAIAEPGILKVDETFRKNFRGQVMDTWGLLTKMTELQPGNMKGAHKILVNASKQFQAYFTEILLSLDNWTPEVAAKLSNMSRDANVTLNTYLARIPTQ